MDFLLRWVSSTKISAASQGSGLEGRTHVLRSFFLSIILHVAVVSTLHVGLMGGISPTSNTIIDLELNYLATPDSTTKPSQSQLESSSPHKNPVQNPKVKVSQNVPKENQHNDLNEGLDEIGEDTLITSKKITKWPSIIYEEKLKYPQTAKKKGLEGTVTLELLIAANGELTSAKVLDGPGQELNEAAMAAIKKFRFSPGYVGNQSVATRIVYKYKFAIE